ncbi:MAG TPA: hypothetical protein VFS43_04740 [Polyangiaceae bacterium]|nr:hypothetical protein [Polyangiaceae bacterium]
MAATSQLAPVQILDQDSLMAKKSEQQENLFKFLLKSFKEQRRFSKEDLRVGSGYDKTTFDTYWSKQLKPLLMLISDNKYIVSESFRPYMDWKKFKRQIVSQKRHVSSDYTTLVYPSVMVFEFFMPLSNEGHLKTALDALFYKDTIMSRLRAIGRQKLEHRFKSAPKESDETYLNRLCIWLSDKFGGYSISHVHGRFRAQPLRTTEEAAKHAEDGGRYLVDETTAVVRFIFPCGDPSTKSPPLSIEHFDTCADAEVTEAVTKYADDIRWLFSALFVQSIVQVVNGEDEIWMIESGLQNRLHVWRVNE